MKEIYLINPNDKGLVISIKREANIILNNINNNSTEYDYNKDKFDDAITVAKAIESTNPTTGEEIESIFSIITKIYSKGILSNLTLKQDEFEKEFNINGNKHNIRYPYIYINRYDNKIYNTNAFNCYIRAKYSHIEQKQLDCVPKIVRPDRRIYLSKGGIITGEYIRVCNIKQNIIDNHNFEVDVCIIPVCIISDKDNYIYAVDHRDPSIKALQNIYEVFIDTDVIIKSNKYNLRKYKKLNV